MSLATVKYIANGYTIQSGGTAAVPSLVYAATIPEVVYWIGRLFDPLAPAAAVAAAAPRVITNPDPLLNQQAQVETVGSGGFIARQLPSIGFGGQQVETYCVDMDAVSAALTAIFMPPPPASA